MKRLLTQKLALPRERRTPLLVDEGNRAAFAAIQTLARGERLLAQPLVLVGPADCGKTRLVEDLVARTAARGGRVAKGTALQWGRRVGLAYKKGALEALIEEIRGADLLVVDEVHRMRPDSVTERILFARIAERSQSGRATVLVSRHSPREIRRLSARSVSLLQSGLVLFVAKAGPAMRRRYLRRISQGLIQEEHADALCAGTPGGLGALREAWDRWRRRAHALRSGGAPGSAVPTRPSLERIAAAVARELGLDAAALLGRRRTKGVLLGRAMFVALARRFGWSPEDLCEGLAQRGRLAVVRLEERSRAVLQSDPALQRGTELLWERLAGERLSTRECGGDLHHREPPRKEEL
ncbi:MAG: ATP-binding protein [Planctomycetes bacterium]|nr:ATP-binding protein [Planctomycetota bacterium]